MKRTYWIGIVLIIVVLAAIGGGYYYYSTSTATTEPETFRVAWIIQGAALDGSWGQFWYEASQKISLVHPEIENTVSEWVDIPDYERVASGYAAQGYDLIVATTSDYQDGALKIAPTYPKMVQLVQGGWLNASNVAGLNIWDNEGGYLAGVLAASMSNTSILGIMGAFGWPSEVANHEGFKLGAKSVNPDIDIKVVWTHSYFDTAIGRSATIALIDQGVDVVYYGISGMALGGIPACTEMGKLAIGAFLDMNSLGPKTVMASVLWLPYGPVMEIIDEIKAGTFDPTKKVYDFGMMEGAIDLSPYHYFENVIPANVKATIANTREAIINGTLTVPLITSTD